ncbi:GtrA family protein [Kitasatospora sp. NPDC094015]|uniref:GtrA family protein n=1 Tax=Kitasatospora sp. NPDC094015 TaxID=3155205 RepID=UPI00332E13B1
MTTTTDSKPSLANRLDGVSGEVVKFGIVGLSGVAVNFVVFWVCINGLGLASLRSNIAATLIAIATNYLGYRYWLYRDRDAASRKREITLFLLFSGAGMLIETGVLGFSVYVLELTTHVEQLAAKLVGLAAGTVFRFFSYRTWVFKALPELAEPAAPAATQPLAAEPAAAGAPAEPAEPEAVVAEAELLLAAKRKPFAEQR